MRENSVSLISLILVNLVPLLGVLFFEWSIGTIMFLYWLETAILIPFNIARILKSRSASTIHAQGPSAQMKRFAGTVASVLGYIFVHGFITYMYGFLVIEIFGDIKIPILSLITALILLAISHLLSYKINFIGKKEYRNVSVTDIVKRTHNRNVILHIVVTFSAIGLQMSGSPAFGLLLLVVIKIVLDVKFHIREHPVVHG